MALPGFRGTTTAPSRVSADTLVDIDRGPHHDDLPARLSPSRPGVQLASWVAHHRAQIEQLLRVHGGLRFRGFGPMTPDRLREVLQAIGSEPLAYGERSSPRLEVSDRVYTSTEHPADQPIFLHNENSYQQTWPLRIAFACVVPSGTGGETPVADVRRVLRAISPRTRAAFAERQVMYIRNFRDGLGLPWRTVFQTDDRAAVEAYCAAAALTTEWIGDRLRTRAVRPAIRRHPLTGEDVWFNHALFFHHASWDPAVRDALLGQHAPDDLPSHACYGDGAAIEPDVLDEVRAAYDAATICEPWQPGDLVLLDNMLVAHGRRPFTGARTIIAAMADPSSGEAPAAAGV
jgi:alpha-ketoglutarate-dependent taurine dioxygenase